jgi:hypothetical protein
VPSGPSQTLATDETQASRARQPALAQPGENSSDPATGPTVSRLSYRCGHIEERSRRTWRPDGSRVLFVSNDGVIRPHNWHGVVRADSVGRLMS